MASRRVRNRIRRALAAALLGLFGSGTALASSSEIHLPEQSPAVEFEMHGTLPADNTLQFSEDVDRRPGLVNDRDFPNIDHDAAPPILQPTTTAPLPPPAVSGSFILLNLIARQILKKRKS